MGEMDEFDEMAKKAIAEARKRIEKAKAEGKGKTTTTTEEFKENGEVRGVIMRTTTTIEESDSLYKSPQVNELEKEIERLEEQVDALETDKKKLKFLVAFWKTAAECEKPRGSCRTCKTTNCFFKKKVSA